MTGIIQAFSTNPLIDIAIGLMAIFLMASLLVTAAQESLAQILSTRSKHLRAALENMLKGTVKNENGQNENLTTRFYDHHLIEALKTSSIVGGVVKNPSYISGGLFRASLMDGLKLSSAGMGLLDAIKARAAEDTEKTNPFVQALSSLAEQAAGDIAVFNKSLDNWFNAVMDRVSGQYKRWTQLTTFLLGLVMALAFNIDAIRAANYLSDRPAVAARLSDQVSARMSVARQEGPATETATEFKTILEREGVPLGWDKTKPLFDQVTIFTLPGWLITALACMLGASLWFDTLKRFVAIRSSGKPPEPADDKAKP